MSINVTNPVPPGGTFGHACLLVTNPRIGYLKKTRWVQRTGACGTCVAVSQKLESGRRPSGKGLSKCNRKLSPVGKTGIYPSQ